MSTRTKNWYRLVTGPQVTITVGPDGEIFELSQNLCCHYSPYFAKAFTGQFKEAVEQVLHLPEDDAAAFRQVALWLYEQQLQIGVIDTDRASAMEISSFLSKLFQIYYLADKLQIKKLQDNVLTRAIHTWHDAFGSEDEDYLSRFIPEVYEKTPAGCPLRRFVVDIMAQSYIMVDSDDMPPDVEEYLRIVPGFAADVFKASLCWMDSTFSHDERSYGWPNLQERLDKYNH